MYHWITPKEVAESQKACPLSIGQAEAGRYTHCAGEACMAWRWNPAQLRAAESNIITVHEKDIPDGYTMVGQPFKDRPEDEFHMVDVMKKPTHGRCGMVP